MLPRIYSPSRSLANRLLSRWDPIEALTSSCGPATDSRTLFQLANEFYGPRVKSPTRTDNSERRLADSNPYRLSHRSPFSRRLTSPNWESPLEGRTDYDTLISPLRRNGDQPTPEALRMHPQQLRALYLKATSSTPSGYRSRPNRLRICRTSNIL